MMRAMRAWRAHAYGAYRDVLQLDEVEPPTPIDDGAVVKVAAASLNFPDLLSIAGKYQFKAPVPFVPGIEAAGTVTAAGPNSRYKVGDRVIASMLWGAFAEQIAVPDASLFATPPEMPDDEAAALIVTYQTSYFALVHRASLQRGETLLVHGGAGGVGISAIQIGKAMGATVIATAGSDDKLEICRQVGADHVINYKDEDFTQVVSKLTGGRGADVIYDPVGGDVFDKSLKCIAWEGRLLVIGFASGRIPEVAANRILLKNISIIGLFWGAYMTRDPKKIRDAHDAIVELYRAKKIKPLVWKSFGFAELPDALGALESRASHGKIVVRP
jgi:NADPH2:quinone reductase